MIGMYITLRKYFSLRFFADINRLISDKRLCNDCKMSLSETGFQISSHILICVAILTHIYIREEKHFHIVLVVFHRLRYYV